MQGGNARIGAFAQVAWRGWLRGHKHHHAPHAWQPPFAVAAASGLGDGVEPRQRAVHHGKVNVHARLHQLGADHAQGAQIAPGAFGLQALFDFGNDILAVCAAHQRRQVQCALGHQALQLTRGFAGVDDGQHAILGAELRGHIGPGRRRCPVGWQFHLHALQRLVQSIGIVDDFAHVGEAAQVFAGIEIRGAVQRGLGGGTQQHRHAVVRHQQIEHIQNGLQKGRRQLLRLVQHDDAARQVVQLSAARGFGCKQRLEQLHVGGNDQRRIPVFAGQTAARSFVLLGGVKLAVVFDQHLITQQLEDLAEHIRCLLNDAGVGNGIDDTALVVRQRMLQRKGQAGESFAAARWHREREEARWQGRLGTALAQDVCAQGVHRVVRNRHGCHVHVERLPHLRQCRKTFAAGGPARVEVCLRVEKVSIHQAGEQHTHPQGKAGRTTRNLRDQISMR